MGDTQPYNPQQSPMSQVLIIPVGYVPPRAPDRASPLIQSLTYPFLPEWPFLPAQDVPDHRGPAFPLPEGSSDLPLQYTMAGVIPLYGDATSGSLAGLRYTMTPDPCIHWRILVLHPIFSTTT